MSELVPVMLMVIVKVAVGVMDVIEMVVDEQAELGVYSTGLIILVSGEAATLALQVFVYQTRHLSLAALAALII